MKKTIILLSATFFSVASFCQDKAKPHQASKEAAKTDTAHAKVTLTVELKPEDWDFILGVINQSNAPHPQVTAVQAVLLQQLQPQMEKLRQKETANEKH